MTDFSNIKQAKYIKLGTGGEWEGDCLKDGTLRLDYPGVPYDLALAQDKEGLKRYFIGTGNTPPKASDHARQVLDFYNCGADTLWITFSGGYLWWTISDSKVQHIEGDESQIGNHLRQAIGGWKNTSINGTPLYMSDLSGKLTRTAGYRQTICDIKADAYQYLMRKLQGQDLPQVADAKKARDQMLRQAEALIKDLTWQDFELFVDLIFSNSGWRRISSLGAANKTLDLELILPSTGERAIVQVKSQTDQAQLNEYTERFASMNADKYFFVYHTAKHVMQADDPKVMLVGPDRLSEMAFSTGMIDWLIEKAS